MEFVNKMRAKKSLSRRKYYIFLDKRRGLCYNFHISFKKEI